MTSNSLLSSVLRQRLRRRGLSSSPPSRNDSSTSSTTPGMLGSFDTTGGMSRHPTSSLPSNYEDDDDKNCDDHASTTSLSSSSREDDTKTNKKQTSKAKKRATPQKSLSSSVSSSSLSSLASGSGVNSSSTSFGRSLLLGLVTFAAVLVAAASSSSSHPNHPFLLVDRVVLSLGGGGQERSGTHLQAAPPPGKKATGAAYIAPPPEKKADVKGSASTSTTTTSGTAGDTAADDNIVASLVPPTAKRGGGRKNPFGRLIQKFVTRKAKTRRRSNENRRWFGSTWDDDPANDKVAGSSSVVQETPATTAPTFTKSMASDLQRRFPTAYTERAPQLTSGDLAHLHEYANVVKSHYENNKDDADAASSYGANWLQAATSSAVAWGGGATAGDSRSAAPHLAWWDAASQSSSKRGGKATVTTELDRLDGGHLLYSYYRIMKAIHDHGKHKNNKKKGQSDAFDLSNVYFPIKKCNPPDGCSAAVSIDHTLRWRESYQPWKVDAKVLRENALGWMYARGWGTTPEDAAVSAPAPRPGTTADDNNSFGGMYGRHAILWSRPGIHRAVDGDAWIKTVLHGADLAVAQSLQASQGRVGKFNAVIDVTGFEWGRTLPAIATIQKCVSALQDHFPNRLGVVALLNLSRGAEIVVNLIKPWLTKDVRDKIHVLSVHDLPLLVDHESIPSWLGGPDTYEFEVDGYYPPRVRS